MFDMVVLTENLECSCTWTEYGLDMQVHWPNPGLRFLTLQRKWANSGPAKLKSSMEMVFQNFSDGSQTMGQILV